MRIATRFRIPRLALTVAAVPVLLLANACGGSDAPPAEHDATTEPHTAATATPDVAHVATTHDTEDTTDTTDEASTVTLVDPAEVYLADINSLIDEITAESNTVALLLQSADVESKAWRDETAGALRTLGQTLAATADIEAPAEYASEHRQLVEATNRYSWATDMLAEGVATLDLNVINDAAALLASATTEFAIASAELAS